MTADWRDTILCGDNLPILRKIPSETVSLIYIDPPFNTGKQQTRKRICTQRAIDATAGDRTGFSGRRYTTKVLGESGYDDSFKDYLGFLRPRLQEARRILTANGSLFFHIDWREAARCRLLLEEVFGGTRHCLNEIIWAYDYGGRAKNKWPTKHDNIYWFAKNPKEYIFNYNMIDRIPYRAPSLVGKEKASRGKTPTDVWETDSLINVWWQTIVPTNDKREKTGYSTQKPLALVERIVRTHSNPGDIVLDFFAGSGTTGEAAAKNDRYYLMVDNSKDADKTIRKRLQPYIQDKTRVKGTNNDTNDIKDFFDNEADKSSQDYKKNGEQWIHSRYGWMRVLSSATRGKLGRQLAWGLIDRVLSCQVEGNRWGLVVNNKRISVKTSMLWEKGNYKFEQLKKTQGEHEVDFFFLLGISPNNVHVWVVASRYYEKFKKQHGEDSRWFGIDPQNPEAWEEYIVGGELDDKKIKESLNQLKTNRRKS